MHLILYDILFKPGNDGAEGRRSAFVCIRAIVRETNPTKPKQERREGRISAKAATDKESSYGAEQMRVITEISVYIQTNGEIIIYAPII